MLTRSPLAAREAEEAIGLPLLGIPQLQDPAIVAPIIGLDQALIREPEEPTPPAWPIEVEGLAAPADDDEFLVHDVDEPFLTDSDALPSSLV